MRLSIGNITCQAIFGGRDSLIVKEPMKKLRRYMSVKVEGYQFMDKFKRGGWDGTRPFVTTSGKFATGYLPMVYRFLIDRGFKVELNDRRGDIPKMIPEFEPRIGKFVAEGKYLFQKDMAQSVNNHIKLGDTELYFPRGIWDCATNAGKTIGVGILTNNWDRPVKTLFLVSTNDLYEQHTEDFVSWFGEDVGFIDSKRYQPRIFDIAMTQATFNKAMKNVNVKARLMDYDVVIVDEGHEGGGKTISGLLQMVGAPIRLMVSGTPLDNVDPVKNLIIVGLSGPVLYTIENKKLIDLKVSQRPTVNIYAVRQKPIHHITKQSWQEEYNELITESEERSSIVADLILDRTDKQILVTFEYIQHGMNMLKELESRPGAKPIAIDLLHGKSAHKKSRMDDFKTGRTNVLFLSRIGKQGLNLPIAQCMIYAQGGKSKIRQKQFDGRILRHDGVSDEVEIIDFWDTGHFVTKHTRRRIKIYKDEGFEVNLMYENKRGIPT